MKFRTLFAILVVLLVPSAAQAKAHCSSVSTCREVATFHHKAAVANNVLIDRALDVKPHPRPVPVCHTLVVCQVVAGNQIVVHTYTVQAWHHITVDQSVNGVKHAIHFWFGPYANVALKIASCESDFKWNSWNGLDDGPFQYELFAHPDIIVFHSGPLRSQAEIVWWAVQRAYRDSNGGRGPWHPMWSCATHLGIE